MAFKIIGFVIIAGISVMLFIALRTDNRADAASGNCYSASSGPSSPTICQ